MTATSGAVRRYHPALVVLHWLVALLVLVGLVMGTFGLSTLPNSSPDKIGTLRGHMIAGGAILILLFLVTGLNRCLGSSAEKRNSPEDPRRLLQSSSLLAEPPPPYLPSGNPESKSP